MIGAIKKRLFTLGTDEPTECDICGETMASEHGVKVHKGREH